MNRIAVVLGCLVVSGSLGAEPPAPWPQHRLTYWFDASVTPAQRNAIAQAMAVWSSGPVTLEFHPLPDSPVQATLWWLGWSATLRIRVASLAGFAQTTLGVGTHRELVFDPTRTDPAWMVADLAHEVGHALGLTHEHQRWDRDRYVAFPPGFLDSLPAGRRIDYALDPTDPLPGDLRLYDYNSLMHYSSNIDGNRMVRRDTGEALPGRRTPSPGDWARLARLYPPEVP